MGFFESRKIDREFQGLEQLIIPQESLASLHQLSVILVRTKEIDSWAHYPSLLVESMC